MAPFPTVHSEGWHLLPSFVVSSWALWSFEFIHKLRILYMWFIEDLRFLWLLLRSLSCHSVVESKLAMQSINQRGKRCASDWSFLMKGFFKLDSWFLGPLSSIWMLVLVCWTLALQPCCFAFSLLLTVLGIKVFYPVHPLYSHPR